jgi:fucose 4-O-acetylase-like acetyltransferase
MRDTYVDVAKGVLILLIVSIHAEVFSVIGTPFSFIAVPMFFFMSGFYDHKHSIKTTLKKNLRS